MSWGSVVVQMWTRGRMVSMSMVGYKDQCLQKGSYIGHREIREIFSSFAKFKMSLKQQIRIAEM